jgi:hypothetical protein
MIIRTCFKCLTCEQPHTVRIAMGQENYQSHRFRCCQCGEAMVVGMRVDYQEISYHLESIENCEQIDAVANAPVVNVDPNRLLSVDEVGKDSMLPRLEHLRMMTMNAEASGRLIQLSAIPAEMRDARPFRRPDLAGEWRLLKTAWSLHSNGQELLSKNRIDAASAQFYTSDPLQNLQDWLWRFVLFIGQPAYEEVFMPLMLDLKSIMDMPGFAEFRAFYNIELSIERGRRYFELMSTYFSAAHDFGQVIPYVTHGMTIPEQSIASSCDLASTRMFYGNAFEAFASSVDILAYLNNVSEGRPFGQFQARTREIYVTLDKASRFRPFENKASFAALCVERDNQLRNASHHGSFQFELSTQTIKYRGGKGSTGPENILPYGTYLERCTRLFLQAMTLLRAEILMCYAAEIRPPI